ncbi:hypothetical protein HOA59_02335 [archaeon]|jgi:hypothetical protein|nr:hypothetical protein [archaeon]MBT6824252.1 hypothetical protein [archaeon]MBT7106818.1 hypothetical protein [archaeon]MBT7297511.1 hypothetical protein [archaeon]
MRWIQLILVFLITSLLVSAQNETGFNPDVPLADQIIEWQDEFELPEEGFIYPLTLGLTITDTEEDLILEITEEGITILNESTPIDMNINLTTDIISNISSDQEELENIIEQIDIESKSTKSHAIIGALEKKYDITIIENPNLWYKIVRFFVGLFV